MAIIIFPIIVNSFEYKVLKHENDGKLFDIALQKIVFKNFNDILLVEDSQKACEAFPDKDGRIIRFVDTKSFLAWYDVKFSNFSLIQ